jgi:hypothetical protein
MAGVPIDPFEIAFFVAMGVAVISIVAAVLVIARSRH